MEFRKVSHIGCGVMGMGMALNLGEKNNGQFDYLVLDANPKALEQFQEKGWKTSSNLNDALDSDVVFMTLPNTKIVQSVILGEDGFLAGMQPGQILVDCSTISYMAAIEISKKCAEKGVIFMDCPISGHHAKSMAGTLTFMCGGDEATFNKIKPLLDMMGEDIMYMGENGCGQLTKMINNCVMNSCISAFCEMMPLGVKLGLPADKLGHVLTVATGASTGSKTLIPKILEGDFAHGFSLDRAYKDMKSMVEVMSEYSVPLPTFYGTMMTYQLALQEGHGDDYKGAMIKFYEKMLDVKVRKSGFENT